MDQLYADGLFSDEVVLITGGGTGIGLVAATEMGLLGAKVALCGRRPDPLRNAVAELGKKGIESFATPCDIREPEAVAAYVDSVIDRFGRIADQQRRRSVPNDRRSTLAKRFRCGRSQQLDRHLGHDARSSQ
jgi:NAD(P)-dependent dehydrogenase (short-subunit alcohol dehydrogenase family)